MAALSMIESNTASPEVTPTRRNPMAEIGLIRVLSAWKGDFVADACIAATQIGLLHSGGVLGFDQAKEVLLDGFNSRKVDDVHWSTVNEAFQNGRSAVFSATQLRERFFPVVAANDNHQRFQITWFDDVDQSTAKEEILHGVLGAGEFSLFVAKCERRLPASDK
jgi:hypothetical protein